MRLITRQEIAIEFRMPLASVALRMAEIGVEPYQPHQKGRGHHLLYDAEEIIYALQNEREAKIAKRKKRKPTTFKKQRPEESLFSMGWGQAKALLTPSAPPQ